ncbi:MAG: hypothetical protein BGO47_05840 [Microbacterium sp. 67-17]|uniref:hypothetical protein n=1 Tax=Microbacterium sp. 67-17 TaxID=1895782 RepID=UPI00095B7610|nr:hypothetical protein [Microbacterium sp. 67-17]OJV93457.1 MAG: hypothetical protein BGO47_05840 [Microbacterium sp. 67-17]
MYTNGDARGVLSSKVPAVPQRAGVGDGVPGAEFPDPEAFDLQRDGAFDDVVDDFAVRREPVPDLLAGTDDVLLQRGLTGVDDAGVGGVGRLRDWHPRGIRDPRDVRDLKERVY